MATIGTVLEFYNSMDPKSNLPRVSFYNYLRHTRSPIHELTLDVIHDFILRACSHSYWNNHLPQLCESLFSDLKGLPRGVNFDLKEILKLQDCQIVDIKSFDNYYDLLRNREDLLFKDFSKLQFIQINEKDLMVIALLENEDLEIKVFTPKAFLLAGELLPLPPVTDLKYSSDLELKEDVDQWVQSDNGATYRFTISSGMTSGHSLRLPSFAAEDVVSGKLQKNLKLLSAVKVLERYFIDPHSDPLYQSLCREIEDAQRLIDTPSDRSRAEQVLRRARLTHREIFPNDKLLLLLVTNLEHKLNRKSGQLPWASPHPNPHLKANPVIGSDLTSSFLKAELPADEKPTI